MRTPITVTRPETRLDGLIETVSAGLMEPISRWRPPLAYHPYSLGEGSRKADYAHHHIGAPAAGQLLHPRYPRLGGGALVQVDGLAGSHAPGQLQTGRLAVDHDDAGGATFSCDGCGIEAEASGALE